MIKPALSEITKTDFLDVVAISDACFGKKYITETGLSKMLDLNCLLYKIVVNEQIVGFCLAQSILAQKNNFEFALPDSKTDTIVVIKTIAIHPGYQRQGFGTLLLRYVMQKINDLANVSAVYYPAWIEPKSEGFCKKVKNEGFKEYKLYKQFWRDDSLLNKYKCIICGNPPCTCSMMLYRQSL